MKKFKKIKDLINYQAEIENTKKEIPLFIKDIINNNFENKHYTTQIGLFKKEILCLYNMTNYKNLDEDWNTLYE